MVSGWIAQRRRAIWSRAAFLTAMIGLFSLPLIWTALASFGVKPDDSVSPPACTLPPSLASYAEVGVAEPAFWQELATSTGLSLAATLLTVTIAFLAAYSLARSRFARKQLVVQSLLILASLPVMAYVIPLSDTMRRLYLLDTYPGLALAEAAVNAPLAVYILYGYVSQLLPDWEDAARLDGAALGPMLWQVALPLIAPGVAATAIIVFVLNWNLFLVPLVLSAGRVKTIPVAMSDFFTFERELEWPTAAAALIISFLPLMMLVGIAHRWLEQFQLHPAQQS